MKYQYEKAIPDYFVNYKNKFNIYENKNLIPIKKESFLQAIKNVIPVKYQELNIKAFELAW